MGSSGIEGRSEPVDERSAALHRVALRSCEHPLAYPGRPRSGERKRPGNLRLRRTN